MGGRNRKNDLEMNERNKRKDVNETEFKMPNHGCTDIICSIIFLIFLIGLVVVSVFAYVNGNPSDLILPKDSIGNICGKTKGYENKKYLLFFDITQCITFLTTLSCPTRQICVQKCPNETLFNKIPSHQEKLKDYCFNSTLCPSYVIQSEPLLDRCVPSLLKGIVNATSNLAISAFDNDNKTNITIETSSAGDLTVDKLKTSVNYITKLLDLEKIFQFTYKDFVNSYPFILGALGIGALISLIWLFVLRYIVKPVVYLSILVVFGLLGFSLYFCVNEYIRLKNKKTEKFELKFDFEYYADFKETWLGLSIISGALLLIFALIMLFLRKRIVFAANIIKEVSKAVISVPASFIWPIIPFTLLIIVIAYCCSVSLFLASSGTQLYRIVDTFNASNSLFTNITSNQSKNIIYNNGKNLSNKKYKIGDFCIPEKFYADKTNDSLLEFIECFYYSYGYPTNIDAIDSELFQKYYGKVIEFLNEYQYIPQIYVAFMLFWLIAFITGLNQMTLAGSFGIWYWTPFKNEKRTKKKSLPFFTLFKSFLRALFLHFGTIAFGSLLIAIVKLIRLILELVHTQVKSKADSSKLARFFMSCCKCCFWCLERFIKFMNRYSYIITAVYGKNFCQSAAKAFKLITSNVLRIAVTDRIANIILFLSNTAITILIGVFSFYFFTKKIPLDSIKALSPELNYYVVPLVVIIIGTYLITKVCFDVFAMGIDSLLICVLIDLDENDGSSQRPYFMSKSLRDLVGKNKKY